MAPMAVLATHVLHVSAVSPKEASPDTGAKNTPRNWHRLIAAVGFMRSRLPREVAYADTALTFNELQRTPWRSHGPWSWPEVSS